MVPALAVTIADLKLLGADTALVKLAATYAIAIDAGGDLDKLGPKLLDCLTALGATPAARAAKGAKPAQQASRLTQLRAAHAG
jgi:hypothetical protein